MDLDQSLLRYAFPALIAIALGEAYLIRRAGSNRYDWRESAASLVIGVGQQGSRAVAAAIWGGVFVFAWQYRAFTVPLDSALGWVALFVGVEFSYYWLHRISHECRWFWASHAVHHSSQHFNLSAAYRLGWTAGITGASLFFLPLVLLGFSPLAVFAVLGINLLYQFWIHTELIPKLGPLEWVLNTPAHHRIHHAANVEYLDANYGGILIVFDRLFGTLAEERADIRPRYGLVTPLKTHNPLAIVFHEWRAVIRDVCAANSFREALLFLFGRPGWRPAVNGSTTSDLRRAA